MLTIDGLVTGLDTASIVEGLLSVQQTQIDQLQQRRATINAEQTAFGGVEARLISLRSSLSSLSRSRNNVLDAKLATSNDEAAVTVAATADAATGTHTFRVDALAQAHQVVSGGFASTTDQITQGTFTIQVGAESSKTITIDATNDTLSAFVNEINSADAGVTATIINDNTATPYRILLTSETTGAANSISITNNLAATGGGATKPVFDTGNPVQAAADASITLGSGAGAITVFSETNQVEDLIAGVTLDLRQADAAKEVRVTIDHDAEAAETAIRSFVDSFNGLMEYIDEQVKFESETGEAGLLLGDSSVTDIQNQVRQAVLESVPNVDSTINRLSTIGISVTDKGQLQIDSSRLQDVLTGRADNVDRDDVRQLFSLDGRSTNSGIEFLLGGTRTEASNTFYEVDITQAAEQATITAAGALGNSTTIDATNNSLTINLDGREVTLTLADGTYTRDQVAAHLQAVINSDEGVVGSAVTVAVVSNKLQVTSDAYGGSSEVTIVGGTSLADLGFDGTESDFGLDVQGSFIVDGVTETATGSGRLLRGDSDNANTADLQVRVSLTSTQVQAGVDGQLTVTRGVASRLGRLLGDLLDPVDGRVKTITDGFETRSDDLQAQIEAQNARFERQQEELIAQFVALESAVQELQTTGNFLAAQLSNLPIPSSSGVG